MEMLLPVSSFMSRESWDSQNYDLERDFGVHLTPSRMDEQPFANLEIDDLDDATHSSMDEAVLADTGSDPNEQRLSLLLRCIVGYCAQLDQEYLKPSAAVTLLTDHPELGGMLLQAWEARSFKEIRNLSMCSATLLSWVIEQCDWYRNSSTRHSNCQPKWV